MLLPVVVEGALRLERGLALRALEAVVERRHVALARVLHRDVRVLCGARMSWEWDSHPTVKVVQQDTERNNTLSFCPETEEMVCFSRTPQSSSCWTTGRVLNCSLKLCSNLKEVATAVPILKEVATAIPVSGEAAQLSID